MTQNHPLHIKRATKDDMSKIARFISSSADWYRPFLEEKDMGEHSPDHKWIEKNYTLRDFYIGVNHKREEIGTISLQFFGDVTYLGYIYLDTKFVGKGYGKRLMDHARKISHAKSKKAMILIAHPEAEWATKAYEKYGFRKVLESREEILNYRDGLLEEYYEEGFHLYEYLI